MMQALVGSLACLSAGGSSALLSQDGAKSLDPLGRPGLGEG
jgi:hypothetical protein